MNKLYTILLIALLAYTGYSACSANTAGAKTCNSNDAATCFQGYMLNTTPTPDTCDLCAAGSTNDTGTTSGTCVACPVKQYCDGKKADGSDPSGTADLAPNDCPAGYYCPASTVSAAAATPCPDGKGSAAAGAGAAADCSVTCATGSNFKTCKDTTATGGVLCMDGFTLGTGADAGKCIACGVANAQTCTYASKGNAVDTCQDGFYKKASTASPPTDALPDTCAQCTGDACVTCDAVDNCTKAKQGWYLQDNAGQKAVTVCGGTDATNGKMTNIADNILTSCKDACTVADCITCNTDVAACDQCATGKMYDATAKKCSPFTPHVTCKAANSDQPTDCTDCDDTQFRVKGWADPDTKGSCKCKDGYIDLSATSTQTDPAQKFACQKCLGDNVKTCDKNLAALTCTADTFVAAGAKGCLAQPTAAGAATVDGLYVDSNLQYVACDTVCKKCTGAGSGAGNKGACLACDTTAIAGTAPTSSDPKFKAYLKAAFYNDTGQECLTTCPVGYKADDAQATCVADSNSVILSALALIFSLFLIF